jgi:hypothetical protein
MQDKPDTEGPAAQAIVSDKPPPASQQPPRPPTVAGVTKPSGAALPPTRASASGPTQRRVVSGSRVAVSQQHPWGGVDLTLDDGSVVFVGNDLIKAAPYR